MAPKLTSNHVIQNNTGYVQVLSEPIKSVRIGRNRYINARVAKIWENFDFSHIAKKRGGHRKKEGGSKRGVPFFVVEDRLARYSSAKIKNN